MSDRFHCYCPCGSCEDFSHCYRGECDAPKPSLWAVIAEAVANFIAEDDQEWAEEYTQAQRDEFAASIPRLLAALKAAGIAVVELPVADGQGQFGFGVHAEAGDVIDLDGDNCAPPFARSYAGALLAAADAAEAQR